MTQVSLLKTDVVGTTWRRNKHFIARNEEIAVNGILACESFVALFT